MSLRLQGKDGKTLDELDVKGQKESVGSIKAPNYDLIAKLKPATVSVHECWWGVSRIPGQYVHCSARAELENDHSRDFDNHPGCEFMKLEMTGRNIHECRELYVLIMSGKILPAVSYEEKQIETPARQVRDLIRELWCSVLTEVRSRMAA